MHTYLNYCSGSFFIFLFCLMFQSNFVLHAMCTDDKLPICQHRIPHSIAVVTKPVVDLFEAIPQNFNSKKTCAAPGPFNKFSSCSRDHQAVFNNQFCLIAKDEDGFSSTISPNVKNSRNQETHFKVNNQDIMIVNQNHPPFQAIPAFNRDKKIITLLYPWNIYSIGTQFVADKALTSPENGELFYQVLIPNFENSLTIPSNTKDQIPKHMTTEILFSDKNVNLTHKERFVACAKTVLKMMKNQRDTIPYVWGGASFITNQNNHPFVLNVDDGNWHLCDRADNSKPYTGFDCSGLVWLLLKLINFPQPWRNSTEMAAKFNLVDSHERLEAGDLLWFPGHITIILDPNKGTLCEARGYGSGYGKVHKITVANYFNEVKSFQKMFEYLKEKKPLSLKNKRSSLEEESTDQEPLNNGSFNVCTHQPKKLIYEWAFLSIPDEKEENI